MSGTGAPDAANLPTAHNVLLNFVGLFTKVDTFGILDFLL